MAGNTERVYSEFGALVVAHRRRLGSVTQAELARRIGLSRTSVTNIEQGRHHVSLHQFLRIASALEVAPEALLPHLPQMEPVSKMGNLLPEGLSKDLVEWADRL